MRIYKKLKQEAAGKSEAAIALMSLPSLIGINLAAQVIVLWLSAQEKLFPGTDMFMSIIATCSQIIAGLYGTTLAGYTFFLSRIDALCATDMTLDYVVTSVKTRFKHLIWYINITVATTLGISLILMYYPVSSGLIPDYLYRLICNEFVLFLGFSVALILYYSLLVIDPNCLSKEAAKLKRKISNKFGPDGSAAEFIALYDRIENLCNCALPDAVLQQLHDNKGKRFEYTLELIYEVKPALRPVLPDLYRIHRYYECMVNCSPLRASQEMCLMAGKVVAVLEHPAHGLIEK